MLSKFWHKAQSLRQDKVATLIKLRIRFLDIKTNLQKEIVEKTTVARAPI